MTVAYATSADYVTETGREAPADIDRLLERASELLDEIVVASFAVDDETELPTDAETAEALRKAACFQVAFWDEVSEANDIDGLAGTTIMLSGATGYQGTRPPVVSPRALRTLRLARLMSSGCGGWA